MLCYGYSRAFRPDGNYGIQVDIPGNMAAATFFTFYFMFILWFLRCGDMDSVIQDVEGAREGLIRSCEATNHRQFEFISILTHKNIQYERIL